MWKHLVIKRSAKKGEARRGDCAPNLQICICKSDHSYVGYVVRMQVCALCIGTSVIAKHCCFFYIHFHTFNIT